MGEPGGPPSVGSHRVRHDSSSSQRGHHSNACSPSGQGYLWTCLCPSLHWAFLEAETESFILAFLRDLACFFSRTGYTAVNEIIQEVKTVELHESVSCSVMSNS